MTKPPNFVPWPDGKPPVIYPLELPFALQGFSDAPNGIPDRCHLLLLGGFSLADGPWTGYRICRSYCGHVDKAAVRYTSINSIARFRTLPPLSVVEALAESLGLTLVWPDVAEGDEPSGQEDAA